MKFPRAFSSPAFLPSASEIAIAFVKIKESSRLSFQNLSLLTPTYTYLNVIYN
jgi:hypothetical protein